MAVSLWAAGDLGPKGVATHSSVLPRRIPWTEKPAGLNHGVRKSWTPLERLTLFSQWRGYVDAYGQFILMRGKTATILYNCPPLELIN